jgi:hypothetical protein
MSDTPKLLPTQWLRQVTIQRDLLRDCHKLLASYGSAHAGGIWNQRMNEAWHKKRVELLERIGEVVK